MQTRSMTKRARSGEDVDVTASKKAEAAFQKKHTNSIRSGSTSLSSLADPSELSDPGKFTYTEIDQSRNNALNNPEACFFGLSGELRNRIYRYALVEEDATVEMNDNRSKPGILRVCRQAQREATRIFLEENHEFVITVHNYKLSCPPWGHWVYHVNWTVEYTGRPVWKNLKKWMHSVHADKAFEAPTKTAGSRLEEMPIRTCEIVHEMKHVEWAVVAGVLEQFKSGIDLVKPRFWR